MKFIAIALVFINLGMIVSSIIKLDNKLQNSREEANRLRREKEMYAKLYRTANTRITQFNDSIKTHCICK